MGITGTGGARPIAQLGSPGWPRIVHIPRPPAGCRSPGRGNCLPATLNPFLPAIAYRRAWALATRFANTQGATLPQVQSAVSATLWGGSGLGAGEGVPTRS